MPITENLMRGSSGFLLVVISLSLAVSANGLAYAKASSGK
jgi:hypothetical protein